MINEGLDEYYRMNGVLQREWEFSIHELEEMIPFEREVYTSLILQHLEEKKNKQG